MYFFKKKKQPQPEPPLFPGDVPLGGAMAPPDPPFLGIPAPPPPPCLELGTVFRRSGSIPLTSTITSIGRAPNCTIVIPSANTTESRNSNLPLLASRRHCELRLSNDDRVHIQDTGSTHGTYLNGVRLQSGIWTDVPDNAEVWLGHPEIKFTVRYHPSGESSAAAIDGAFIRVDL